MRLIGLITLAALFCCQPAFAMRGEQPKKVGAIEVAGPAAAAAGGRLAEDL